MYSTERHKRDCYCIKGWHHPHAILYNILSRKDRYVTRNGHWSYSGMHFNCHCKQHKLVSLRNPEVSCKAASAVLLKTVHFMKSLPSFHQLPCTDQLTLLRSCWVPLFVLGLAQEHVVFEVTDMPTTSILRKILLNDPENRETDCPSTLAAVHNLKSCLNKLWSLDLTAKEYAYLKGTVLFNPDMSNVISYELIKGLQKEAQQALHELIHTRHPNFPGRFAHIFFIASALHTVAQSFITELFFRPIIGQTDINELLLEKLFS
ncbi:nuclear receptor subfamily 0, group B, member 2b [Salminus brasiliensis]|uniref:nuclear receptor subfamily 0, group B, member 2b n=1 Tax=Salminus brasiliensis TaxID=930266 RepID=UPI003B83895F